MKALLGSYNVIATTMIRFCLFALLLVVVTDAFSFKANIHSHWQKFKQAHNKDYHPHLELKKRIVFADNVKKIMEHNLQADMGEHSHKLGVNKYSDMPHTEFVKKMNGLLKGTARRLMSRSNNMHVATVRAQDLPSEVDWVKAGSVTSVKDQGECGSCWAFSAVGAMEGAWHKKTGELVSLSEQNLVDCADTKYGNNGCDGGLPDNAFRYVVDRKGVDKNPCYPYYGMQFNCYFNPTCIGANLTSYNSVEEGNEEALKEALATIGPISIAIDASHESLQHYKEGIYSDPECSPTELDHAVLLVGYGTENGKDFWLIKNSWGESWGLNGYVKIARNAKNMCGVGTYTSYPIV